MEILTVVLIVVAIEAGLYGICCFMCREKPVPEERGDNQKKEDADDMASLRSSCSWYYPPGL
jgi:hypothetical protein